MHRFFFESINHFEGDQHCKLNQDLDPGSFEDTVTLSKEESHHAQVLRLKPGDEITLLDGMGSIYAACLVSVGASCVARITGVLENHEPNINITLYQGLPKADKMEWIVQKSTELGVHAIQPVLFSRCDKTSQSMQSIQRYRRIAREAVKQCGRGLVPTVAAPIAFSEVLTRISMHAQALVAWEEMREARIADVFTPGLQDIALVIGPEGGITAAEAERLTSAGAHLLSLGQRILRTETASIAALSAIFTLAGEL